jgi:Cu(I)/Ag(I) efflux system membrane fusion protein
MKNRIGIALAAFALIAVGLALGYWYAMHRQVSQANAQASAAAPEKKPLYWHDPMYPQQKFDKPGKSPFMDMPLVPVYGEGGSDSSVQISSRVAQNLGIRTVEAKRGTLRKSIEAVGTIAFDERSVALVQARVGGYVERLFVRAPLDPVSKGQALAEIFAPDWVAAQEEYLALRRSPQADDELRRAARQRLVLLGMPDDTITAIESSGKAQPRVTLHAPLSGVVAELGAREGMTVMPGATLFRINGLANVWINIDIPESQASAVNPGAPVQAAVAGYPGEKFSGRVATVLPEVNPSTRTLKARVELPNAQGRLKPGMYATVDLTGGERREAVLVPSEAVIRTGQRTVVVIADIAKDGKQQFKPIDVVAGDEADGMTEILKGIEPGVKVVASGQFLIDSESSLKTTLARMSDAPASESHHGEGRVEKIDKDEITLSHGAIASMQWGPMTMAFRVPKSGVPPDVREGAMASFDFVRNAKGEFELTAIRPVKEARK